MYTIWAKSQAQLRIVPEEPFLLPRLWHKSYKIEVTWILLEQQVESKNASLRNLLLLMSHNFSLTFIVYCLSDPFTIVNLEVKHSATWFRPPLPFGIDHWSIHIRERQWASLLWSPVAATLPHGRFEHWTVCNVPSKSIFTSIQQQWWLLGKWQQWCVPSEKAIVSRRVHVSR